MESLFLTILAIALAISIVGHFLQWAYGRSNRNIVELDAKRFIELKQEREQMEAEKTLLKEQLDGINKLCDEQQIDLRDYKSFTDSVNGLDRDLREENENLKKEVERFQKWTYRARDPKTGQFIKKVQQ